MVDLNDVSRTVSSLGDILTFCTGKVDCAASHKNDLSNKNSFPREEDEAKVSISRRKKYLNYIQLQDSYWDILFDENGKEVKNTIATLHGVDAFSEMSYDEAFSITRDAADPSRHFTPRKRDLCRSRKSLLDSVLSSYRRP